jgi:hypothetical protein
MTKEGWFGAPNVPSVTVFAALKDGTPFKLRRRLPRPVHFVGGIAIVKLVCGEEAVSRST